MDVWIEQSGPMPARLLGATPKPVPLAAAVDILRTIPAAGDFLRVVSARTGNDETALALSLI